MFTRFFVFSALVIAALALGACGGGGAPAGLSDAQIQEIAADTSFSSRGDVARGQEVFNTRCISCHSTGTDQLVGPGMAGIFSPEGPTLPSGVDYGGRLPNEQNRTETNVAAWIQSGGQGQIGAMSAQGLSDQELADVIAYMRTLNK
jgi:cytochrome c